jgi:hypothetical protein
LRISSRQLLQALAAEIGGSLTFPDIVADVYRRAEGRPRNYTVRMFEDLLWQKIGPDAKPGFVQDVRATYRHVCSILSRICGVPARSIRPSTKLDQVLPRPERFKSWIELSRQLNWRLPRLRVTARGQRIGRICGALLLVVVYVTTGWVVDTIGSPILHAFGIRWGLIV